MANNDKKQNVWENIRSEIIALNNASEKDKNSKIEELKEKYKEKEDYAKVFPPLWDICTSFFEDKDEKKFNESFDKFVSENEKIEENIIDTGANIYDIKTATQKVVEAGLSEGLSLDPQTVEDTIKDEAFMSEELSDESADGKKNKQDDEKNLIKKIYKYKVEGEISSGIPDLDRFLKIMKPALDQMIILPWRGIYQSIDGLNFLKDKAEARYIERDNIKGGFSTLKKLEEFYNKQGQNVEILKTQKDFKQLRPNKTSKEPLLKDFKAYMTAKTNAKAKELEINDLLGIIDENHRQQLDTSKVTDTNYLKDFIKTNSIDTEGLGIEIDSQEWKAKYGERKDFLDYKFTADAARIVIDEEMLNLVAHVRGADGKISPDGANILKGYCGIFDLLNPKNKDVIISQYANDLEYILKEAKQRSKAGKQNIEKENAESIISYLDGEATRKSNLADLLAQAEGTKTK